MGGIYAFTCSMNDYTIKDHYQYIPKWNSSPLQETGINCINNYKTTTTIQAFKSVVLLALRSNDKYLLITKVSERFPKEMIIKFNSKCELELRREEGQKLLLATLGKACMKVLWNWNDMATREWTAWGWNKECKWELSSRWA